MAVLIVYSVSVAFLLHPIGIRFTDSFIFASLGFAAHLFEDALVFDPAYSFFWPITSQEFGIGLFHYSADLYGIADSGVLMVGLILVGLAAILRTAFEGTGWIRRMLPVNRIFAVKNDSNTTTADHIHDCASFDISEIIKAQANHKGLSWSLQRDSP